MFKFFTQPVKKLHRGEKGFTLIELLIVIAVLGILAAVAIPNVVSFIASGKLAAANNEIATVQTANQAHAADHDGTYAATVSGNFVVNSVTYLNGGVTGTYNFNPASGLLTTATYSPFTFAPASGSLGPRFTK